MCSGSETVSSSLCVHHLFVLVGPDRTGPDRPSCLHLLSLVLTEHLLSWCLNIWSNLQLWDIQHQAQTNRKWKSNTDGELMRPATAVMSQAELWCHRPSCDEVWLFLNIFTSENLCDILQTDVKTISRLLDEWLIELIGTVNEFYDAELSSICPSHSLSRPRLSLWLVTCHRWQPINTK